MNNQRSGFCLVFLVSLASAYTPVFAQSIADQQQEQVALLLIELNNNAKDVADTIISSPQSALDSGCLSNIQGIDLSVMTVDFTSLWSGVYVTLKNQIIDQACTAATDWVNSQTAQLDTTLQAPYGLGSISISQGSAITDWQSVLSTDVQMSNAALNLMVTTQTLGQVLAPQVIPGTPSSISTNEDTPTHNKKGWESGIGDALDVKLLWEE